MTRILIYAFRPFGGNNINISEEVLKNVKQRKGLKKVYLKTRFEEKIFLDLIGKYKPEMIIGLGQYPRGKRIRIEKRAMNLFGSKNRDDKKILEDGREYLDVNLEIKNDERSFFSFDAGEFVCNYSMYILLNECLKINIKFGFLHIPRMMDKKVAINFIESSINSLFGC